jgi:hypothetical protein
VLKWSHNFQTFQHGLNETQSTPKISQDHQFLLGHPYEKNHTYFMHIISVVVSGYVFICCTSWNVIHKSTTYKGRNDVSMIFSL